MYIGQVSPSIGTVGNFHLNLNFVTLTIFCWNIFVFGMYLKTLRGSGSEEKVLIHADPDAQHWSVHLIVTYCNCQNIRYGRYLPSSSPKERKREEALRSKKTLIFCRGTIWRILKQDIFIIPYRNICPCVHVLHKSSNS